MEIDVNLNRLKTKVDLKEVKLSFVPGRGAKRERWGYICLKDDFHYKIADVCIGELKDSNALAKEIVRRFNDYSHTLNVSEPFVMENFFMHHFVSGTGRQYVLIRKDGYCSIDFYVSEDYIHIGNLNIPPSIGIRQEKEGIKMLKMVENWCRNELKRHKFYIQAGSMAEKLIYISCGYKQLNESDNANIVQMFKDDFDINW